MILKWVLLIWLNTTDTFILCFIIATLIKVKIPKGSKYFSCKTSPFVFKCFHFFCACCEIICSCCQVQQVCRHRIFSVFVQAGFVQRNSQSAASVQAEMLRLRWSQLKTTIKPRRGVSGGAREICWNRSWKRSPSKGMWESSWAALADVQIYSNHQNGQIPVGWFIWS